MFLSLFLISESLPQTTLDATSLASSMSPGVDFTWMFVKVIFAMIVVCAVAFLIIKYVLPKSPYVKANKNSQIEVMERFMLEPRKNLYILKVGPQKILVGTTENSISALTHWADSQRETQFEKTED